jgi:glutamine amidotransferase
MMINKIHIVDYGLGNLFSVCSAIKKIGYEPVVANNFQELSEADFIVLPGVGAFEKGMQLLQEKGFANTILTHVEKGRPILGICLGMQMFFDSSEENGFSKGLGLIPGEVKKIIGNQQSKIKAPHIGWSLLNCSSYTMASVINKKFMYFVHSYHPLSEKYCIAHTDYQGINITAMVNKDNVWGCQFHPEKSGTDGLQLLDSILKS